MNEDKLNGQEISNGTLTPMPEVPAPMPEVPTPMPQAPTPMPQAPTSMSQAPTSMPDAPTSMPDAPTSMPDAPVPMPQAPTPMPEAPTSMPDAPTSMSQAPTSMPQAPTPIPEQVSQQQVDANSMAAVSNLNKDEAMEEALSHTNQYSPFEAPKQEVNQEVKKTSNKGAYILIGAILVIMLLFIVFLPQISKLLGW